METSSRPSLCASHHSSHPAGMREGRRDVRISLPSLCDAQVTWNAYSDFVFGEVGNDATARKLVSQCGWTVQGGHNGGVGDTLQVTSGGAEGVVFVWAFNSFHAFKLAKGWEGSTERGVRIGDSVAALLAAYPNFKRVSAGSYLLSEDNVEVEAHFDAPGALVTLIVGDFFRP